MERYHCLLKVSFKVLQKYDYRPPIFNESKSYTRNALEIGQHNQSKCCTFNSPKITTTNSGQRLFQDANWSPVTSIMYIS